MKVATLIARIIVGLVFVVCKRAECSIFLALGAACSLLRVGSAALAPADAKQPTYETAFYRSGKLQIETHVFKPERAGPFPAVIYNHGSRPGHEREERGGRCRKGTWEVFGRAVEGTDASHAL